MNDTERLDWMERNLRRDAVNKDSEGRTIGICNVWVVAGELGTLRETIDAAAKSGDRIRKIRANG